MQFNGVRVFSATMAQERENLGEKVTDWMSRNPNLEIMEIETHQSSDEAFHCISIIVFYRE
ncbi:MAG: hypothetical protein JXR95_13480 [Deltaproteobacteria bacterium]|nr:hypothetical protein [Deltaproteobacteria bacterium]